MRHVRTILGGLIGLCAAAMMPAAIAQTATEPTDWSVTTFVDSASVGRSAEERTSSTSTARAWAISEYEKLLVKTQVPLAERGQRVAAMSKALKLSAITTAGASYCTWYLDADAPGAASPVKAGRRADYVVVTAQRR